MLPSKKNLVLLALLVIGIGALALYGYNRGSHTVYNSTASQGALTVVTSSSTNSNYIAKEQNTPSTSKNNAATTTTTTEKTTATDIFARDLFSQVVKLSQSGVTVDQSNADQIASDFLKTAHIPNINAQQYTVSNLTIIDSSATNMLTYQNAIIAVFTKNWPAGKDSEMLILKQTFTDKNPDALNNLSNTIGIYKKALNESLSLKVPQLAVAKHLDVINSLSTYIETLKMIQLTYSDPLSGIAGLKVFTANRINLTTSMADLRIYLINTLK